MELCGKEQKTGRKIYLEAMRILAVFFVVFNHTEGYLLGLEQEEGARHWLYLLVMMFTRFNVPLFFMISGALLLAKEESLKILWKKRISRFLMVIFLANLMIYMVPQAIAAWQENRPLQVSAKELASALFAGGHSSYWYLYAHLSALLMLPFLRLIARKMNRELFWYLSALHVLFSTALPLARAALEIASDGAWSLPLSGSFAVPLAAEKNSYYMLAGYYFEHVCDETVYCRKMAGRLWIAALAGMLVECIVTQAQGLREGFSQNYVQMFDYLIAFAVFVSVRLIDGRIPRRRKTERLICLGGSVTFGIYLLDPLFAMYYQTKLVDALSAYLPRLCSAFLYCLISMLVCGAAAWLLKRSRFLRRLL